MNIILERISCTKAHTIGRLSVDGLHFGLMVEPVTTENAEPGQTCAINEGTYELDVVNNPNPGTPAIKVYGKFIQHNIALRSLPPLVKSNASPTFWNADDNEMDNILRWSQLLSFLLSRKENHTLTVLRNENNN